jgi:hypothetical protein
MGKRNGANRALIWAVCSCIIGCCRPLEMMTSGCGQARMPWANSRESAVFRMVCLPAVSHYCPCEWRNLMSMKMLKKLCGAALAVAFLTGALLGLAAEGKKAKPYPLKTCVVSDSKLGEMGDPYVFTYKGREVKLCCKGCLTSFEKDPAKYVKKIEEAEKKAK